jgi:hypothetical protein
MHLGLSVAPFLIANLNRIGEKTGTETSQREGEPSRAKRRGSGDSESKHCRYLGHREAILRGLPAFSWYKKAYTQVENQEKGSRPISRLKWN